ncbi:unnamed protein product [Ilex paraguariensis]|uniref:Uncharacterized protein n=1 Tax=Ilex paraguariensis TaxID=185542 RepID=A0ABC8QZF8_9AQUA
MVGGSVASKLGLRFVFADGSTIILRLLGTGIEQFEPDDSKHEGHAHIALKPSIDLALSVSKLKTSRAGRNLQSSHRLEFPIVILMSRTPH